jgi:hypothetical protein
MSISRKTVKKVLIPISDLNIADYNKKIIECIHNNQDEINYRLNGKLDYSKKIQKRLLKEDEKFKELDSQFLQQSFSYLKDKLQQTLPFIASFQIENRVLEILDKKKYISDDANEIAEHLKLLNFSLIQSLIRIIFSKIKGRNMSSFWAEMQTIMTKNYNNFEEIEDEYSTNHVFFMLQLFANSVNHIKIIFHFTEDESKSLKNMVYQKKVNYTNDGMKNLYQQLDEKLFDIEQKSEYSIWVSLVLDSRIKGAYSVKNLGLFFHEPTIRFLNERRHDIIYNGAGTYLRTFHVFLKTVINPIDQFRYLLAGSVAKSIYNVRDCSDIDFFVLDHEDNIEKYTSYKPNTGEGIYDDFGKTYYGNEKFYFPMIPEMYKKQQEWKKTRDKRTDTLTILNNYPEYSVSGLKAGRYVDIYCSICRKLGYKINNLDDIVSNPEFHIYFLGCPILALKLEMARDIVKDIDLGRISKKQLHDMHYLDRNYGFLFSESNRSIFGFDRLSDYKITRSMIQLELNCYHIPMEDGAAYDLVIRRYPIYIQDILSTLIKNSPLLISDVFTIKTEDSRNVYQKPLLSSLKDKMEISGKMDDVLYYYECNKDGEISIYIMTKEDDDISLYEEVCISGNIRVEIKDGVKKLSVNVSGKKMKNIYQKIENSDKKKEYRLILINIMKNMIQLHKIVDCHTVEKIAVDILK